MCHVAKFTAVFLFGLVQYTSVEPERRWNTVDEVSIQVSLLASIVEMFN